MYTVLAVDPGLSGGYAVMNVVLDSTPSVVSFGRIPVVQVEENGKTKRKPSMPEFASILNGVQVKCSRDIRPVIERVSAMPGNGAVSMFNFGDVYGQLQGMLFCKFLNLQHVQPKAWQKTLFGKSRSGVTKEDIRLAVIDLIEDGRIVCPLELPTKACDDGIFDAIGIGYHAVCGFESKKRGSN